MKRLCSTTDVYVNFAIWTEIVDYVMAPLSSGE